MPLLHAFDSISHVPCFILRPDGHFAPLRSPAENHRNTFCVFVLFRAALFATRIVFSQNPGRARAIFRGSARRCLMFFRREVNSRRNALQRLEASVRDGRPHSAGCPSLDERGHFIRTVELRPPMREDVLAVFSVRLLRARSFESLFEKRQVGVTASEGDACAFRHRHRAGGVRRLGYAVRVCCDQSSGAELDAAEIAGDDHRRPHESPLFQHFEHGLPRRAARFAVVREAGLVAALVGDIGITVVRRVREPLPHRLDKRFRALAVLHVRDGGDELRAFDLGADFGLARDGQIALTQPSP